MAMGFGVVADSVGLGDGAPGCLVPAKIRACALACAKNFGETKGERPPGQWMLGNHAKMKRMLNAAAAKDMDVGDYNILPVHLAPSCGLD